MKVPFVMLAVALVSSTVASQADAKGCLRGAIVGGVAGHFAHHGVLGAMAGCAYGMHRAHQRERMPIQQEQAPQPSRLPQRSTTL
jgi:hypothetical protein